MSSPFSLTSEQKQVLKQYLEPLKSFLKTSEGRREVESRSIKMEFYKGLSPQDLETLDEATFELIIGGLWASEFWSNQDYLVQKLLTDNGLDKLRQELKVLLHGEKPLEERFADCLKHVKGLGPASITELLCYTHPSECAIWNDKSRKGLELLNFAETLPVKKYHIAQHEYHQFNKVVQAIAAELWTHGFEELKVMELAGADLFLYVVWRHRDPIVIEDEEFDHNEVRDQIRQIGTWLGFNAETEKTIAHGARVDAVWRSAIGNLGVVTYVFEVHRSGSIDSLVMNLLKAKNNPTVQKVVAVSDIKQLEKVQNEVQGLPEEFRNALALWRASEVTAAYQHLNQATDIINKLDLVKDSFPLA